MQTYKYMYICKNILYIYIIIYTVLPFGYTDIPVDRTFRFFAIREWTHHQRTLCHFHDLLRLLDTYIPCIHTHIHQYINIYIYVTIDVYIHHNIIAALRWIAKKKKYTLLRESIIYYARGRNKVYEHKYIGRTVINFTQCKFT